jgi:GNAT superfamily N-acetyltransferase
MEIALASADAVDDDAAFWRIYDASFPANEREPRGVIVGSARAGVALVLRARRGDETVGLACVHLLADPAAAFLVYLAVAPPLRGQAIGRAIFEHAFEIALGRLRAPLGMIWEVDAPALATDAREIERRTRRIGFFRRAGGELLEHAYSQPPLVGGAPVPMRLMLRPAAGAPPPDDATVERLVRAIYFEKYGAANGIDERTLRALLASC